MTADDDEWESAGFLLSLPVHSAAIVDSPEVPNLRCAYDEVAEGTGDRFAVSRHAPAGYECRARENGFVCTLPGETQDEP